MRVFVRRAVPEELKKWKLHISIPVFHVENLSFLSGWHTLTHIQVSLFSCNILNRQFHIVRGAFTGPGDFVSVFIIDHKSLLAESVENRWVVWVSSMCYEVLWWFRDCQWSAVRQSLLLRPGWHGSLAVVSASTNDSSIIANYFILIYFIYCYWFWSCCCSSFIRSTFVVASTVNHLSSTHHSIHSGIFFMIFFFNSNKFGELLK